MWQAGLLWDRNGRRGGVSGVALQGQNLRVLWVAQFGIIAVFTWPAKGLITGTLRMLLMLHGQYCQQQHCMG